MTPRRDAREIEKRIGLVNEGRETAGQLVAVDQLPPLAITMGDPAGIGPELCLRVVQDPSVLSCCLPVIVGDLEVLLRVARTCDLSVPERVVMLREWNSRLLDGNTPIVLDCQAIDAGLLRPGEIQASCGRAAFKYIRVAIEKTIAADFAGLVTGPIHKQALTRAHIPFPGHTEILATLTGADQICMMLTSDVLSVSMVTSHTGFADVPGQLTPELIVNVIRLTSDFFKTLGNAAPRIGVCGLNPHSGEGGMLGRGEEAEFIEPAIAKARAEGMSVTGPLAPDTAFLPELMSRFDAIVCMYHDQGLIPFKMLAFDRGVHLTLGLPIIRTSVDHGTAFDIAWTGRASPRSMTEAILWAARLVPLKRKSGAVAAQS